LFFKLRKQMLDDFILVAKVVIQVARRNVELVCNVPGGDV
jgi:hypothetical protein